MRLIRQVSWRYVLPLIMVITSAYLMVLATSQEWTISGWGMGWNVPARNLNTVLNAPVWFINSFFNPHLRFPEPIAEWLDGDGPRLPWIALFWFLLGLTLDRRLEGKRLVDSSPFCATLLFLVGAVASFAALTWLIHGIDIWPTIPRVQQLVQLYGWHPLWRSGLWGVWSLTVWLLAFFLYFTWKWIDAARHPRSK